MSKNDIRKMKRVNDSNNSGTITNLQFHIQALQSPHLRGEGDFLIEKPTYKLIEEEIVVANCQ